MSRNRIIASKQKAGLTLVEVLIAIGLFSVMVPSVLMLSLRLSLLSTNGVRHNAALAQSRKFQDAFIRRVNSADSFALSTSLTEQRLIINYRPTASASPMAMAFEYDKRSKSRGGKVVRFYPSYPGVVSYELLEGAFPVSGGSNDIFHLSSADEIQAIFRVRASEDGQDRTLFGVDMAPEVAVNIVASRRN